MQRLEPKLVRRKMPGLDLQVQLLGLQLYAGIAVDSMERKCFRRAGEHRSVFVGMLWVHVPFEFEVVTLFLQEIDTRRVLLLQSACLHLDPVGIVGCSSNSGTPDFELLPSPKHPLAILCL